MENTGDGFRYAWFEAPAVAVLGHSSHVSCEATLQFDEGVCLCAQANVISIDELTAFGGREVVGVHVEKRWSQNRALWEAIFLESLGAGVVSHVDPETPIS